MHFLAPHAASHGGQRACRTSITSASRGSTVRLLSLIALTASCTFPSQVQGQNVFIAATPAVAEVSSGSGRAKPTSSFALPTQGNDLKDAIDEFQRLVEHQAWEKAFKSLETVQTKSVSGFIDRDDGVLMPSRMLVRTLLAGLPPAGKNAYRVFFDPQAMALWEKADGKGEAGNLNAIVNDHLISSVGDRAADRLGDLYFEQGDFEQAALAWRSLFTFCPESKIPQAQTLVKLSAALARSGRWNEFHEVEGTVRGRYAGETVEVAGRRETAAQEIARLAALEQSPEAKVSAASASTSNCRRATSRFGNSVIRPRASLRPIPILFS